MAARNTSTQGQTANLVQLLLSIGILVVLAFLGAYAYTKFDLTAERRHSLTPATETLLEELPDPVFVRCYLTGDLPAKFKRLEQSLSDRLAEFADFSDGMLEYEFIDPYASEDDETRGRIERTLYDQGLRFTRISYENKGADVGQIVWPAAIITYRGQDIPVQFFKSNAPQPDESMINASINNLEYELARSLRMAMRRETPSIAVLEGQGEWGPLSLADLETTLSESYAVERVRIDEQIDALSEKIDGMTWRNNKYDLLVVAGPDSTFSAKDRVILDQFIMNGGKVIWMVDGLKMNLDSLRVNQQAFALRNELGIYDQLFDYGVRINRELVLDYTCEEIVVDAGPNGNQRQYDIKPWYYAPIVTPADTVTHPILTNLGPIHFRFTSSLDLVGDNLDVTQTVLLQSSELSMELPEPAMVSMGRVAFGLDYFKQNARGAKNLAVLLEGEFTSNFIGRLPRSIAEDPNIAFRKKSKPTAQLVIADGDLARNKYSMTQRGPQVLPLGFDQRSGAVVYENKAFLLNAVNYLLDEDALISVRQRTIELRLLDEEKITEDRQFWQVANVGLPLAVVIVFGLGMRLVRRRMYQR
ncbi:MAG: gliding motility-associated ABC transporter substrate-binding protein GldG [Flavobacteriales bacterium]